MRDYTHINGYLDELTTDIYEQPEDVGHSAMAKDVIDRWMPTIPTTHVVLDVGCGTGFCREFFLPFNICYMGLDIIKPASFVGKFYYGDFTFSGLPDNIADLVFSRHTLEHSPFPLLTLMEWHRLAEKYLMLVLPNPDHYTYIGKNHYAVMDKRQARWLLRRAGWEIFATDYEEPTELRFLCRKRTRLGSEGYIRELTGDILSADQQGA